MLGVPKFSTPAYMLWRGEWEQKTYQGGDVVREAGWTMVALTKTTDYPAPQSIGQTFNLYNGASPTSIQSANQILFGTRYDPTGTPFQLSAYRVYAVLDQTYNVYIIVDPQGAGQLTPLASFTAVSTGWVEFDVEPFIVSGDYTFEIISSVAAPDPAPTPIDATYDYLTPQNVATPTAGEIQHARGQPDIMRISYTDDIGGDREALITSLAIGDTISTGGVVWTVQANSDQSTFADITVTPAIVAAAGVQTVRFTTNVPQDITFLDDTDYWLTSPFAGNVNGIIAVDLPYPLGSYNDTAYGIDVTIQEVVLSGDWDVVTPADAASSASARMTEQESTWIRASATPLFRDSQMTTDNTWSEVVRYTIPNGEGIKILTAVDGRRTDGQGYFSSELSGIAFNNGVTDVIYTVDFKHSTEPSVDTRLVIDGMDVVFEIRGATNEDWNWNSTIYAKGIEG